MAAGSIIIDLLLKTGSFETDAQRAEKAVTKLNKEIVRQVEHLKFQAEQLGKTAREAKLYELALGGATPAQLKAAESALAQVEAYEKIQKAQALAIKGILAVGAAAVAGAAGFELLVSGAADFKDLEEQVGASAEDLASLAIAAAVAGTSVAEIASQANKLTKNLQGVDDESKAAGAALTALGIPIEDFKKLDPVGQIDALSKAFNGFADGSQKTAVALALFGKSGAQMLNVFKELDAEGGRNKILTQQQIELADEFTDRQKRQAATIKAYAQAGATDLLPVLNDLTTAAKELAAEFFGVDSAGKKLATESPVKAWGEAVVDTLAFVIDAAQGVARVFQVIGVGIGGAVAAIEATQRLQFGAAKDIAQQTARDIDAILSPELFSQRLARIRAAAVQAGLADPNQSGAETARLARKPQLAFDGAIKTAKGGDKQSEAERYLETLQKQAEKTLDLTTEEQALLDIQQKRIKGLTPELEKQILAQARFNDLNKQAIAFRTAEIEVQTNIGKAQLAALDAITKGNDKLAEEIELLGLDADALLAYELQKVRITKAEKEATLAKQAGIVKDEEQLQVLQAEIDALQKRESLLLQKSDKQADIDNAKRNVEDLSKDAGVSMSESIAQGILDGTRKGLSFADVFERELKAQFAKVILAPIIRPVVDAQNQGVAGIISAIGGLFGGSGNTTDYRGAELPSVLRGGADTGTNMLERDMITLVHKGEAIVPKAYNPAAGGSGYGGGTIQVINNLGVQATAREEQQRGPDGSTFRRLILDTVESDFASGTGPASRAAQGRLGTGAGTLPRRR